MVWIVADAREQASGVPRHLRSLRATVRDDFLGVGDYVVAPGCVVERKSVRDLHLSLSEGRLWPQLGALRRGSDEHYLLVEGRHLLGPVHPESIRGALLAVSDLGITILRSTDPLDSAQWLLRLALRRQQGETARVRPAYAQRPQAPPESIAAAMLSAVPGISHVVATRLLERFGSVANVAAAASHEWTEVDGVGARRAAALEQAVRGTSYSGQRNGCPAT
jgi:ERCC4-type nuclease